MNLLLCSPVNPFGGSLPFSFLPTLPRFLLPFCPYVLSAYCVPSTAQGPRLWQQTNQLKTLLSHGSPCCGHTIQSISRSWKDGDGQESRVRTRGVMGAVLDNVVRRAFLWTSEERPECSAGENHAVLQRESILETLRRLCKGPQGRRPRVCEDRQDGTEKREGESKGQMGGREVREESWTPDRAEPCKTWSEELSGGF